MGNEPTFHFSLNGKEECWCQYVVHILSLIFLLPTTSWESSSLRHVWLRLIPTRHMLGPVHRIPWISEWYLCYHINKWSVKDCIKHKVNSVMSMMDPTEKGFDVSTKWTGLGVSLVGLRSGHWSFSGLWHALDNYKKVKLGGLCMERPSDT